MYFYRITYAREKTVGLKDAKRGSAASKTCCT